MFCFAGQRLLSRDLSSLQKSLDICKRLLSIRKHQEENDYQIVKPCKWTHKERVIRSDIAKPDYWQSGLVSDSSHYDLVKNEEQVKGITTSCKIAQNILTKVGQQLKPGISGEDIDDMVFELSESYECYPSRLNYKGFPKCVMTSVNNVAQHGIPDSRQLVSGDLITVDVSIFYKGYHGECAHTYVIGQTDEDGWDLLETAGYCLFAAINICKDGVKLAEIGKNIEIMAKFHGFNVFPGFCGHGIGHNLHEPPEFLHHNNTLKGIMKENMCITIEPVITEGREDGFNINADGYSISTYDNARTAQFVHTILITKDKPIILTKI